MSVFRFIQLQLLFVGLMAAVSCSSAGGQVSTVTDAAENPIPASAPANLESIEIELSEFSPVEVRVIAKGRHPDGCTGIGQINQQRIGGSFRVTLEAVRTTDSQCAQVPVPFEETINLDVVGLESGLYIVDVNGHQGTFTLQSDNVVDEENAVVGGRIWQDFCDASGPAEGVDAGAGIGCVADGSGSFQADGIQEPEEPGLSGVVVKLGSGACPAGGLATTITDGNGFYLFGGLKSGTYCVSVDTQLGSNASVLAKGIWTHPASDIPGQTTIALAPGESKMDLNMGWDSQLVPDDESEAEETEETQLGCTDVATFLADVSIPDDTVIDAGETFTKTWQLLNAGTCTWGTGYNLIHFEGEPMGARSAIPLSSAVEPGEATDLSVRLTAPSVAGTYRGDWKLRNDHGILFGIGDNANKVFWVQIVVEE